MTRIKQFDFFLFLQRFSKICTQLRTYFFASKSLIILSLRWKLHFSFMYVHSSLFSSFLSLHSPCLCLCFSQHISYILLTIRLFLFLFRVTIMFSYYFSLLFFFTQFFFVFKPTLFWLLSFYDFTFLFWWHILFICLFNYLFIDVFICLMLWLLSFYFAQYLQ